MNPSRRPNPPLYRTVLTLSALLVAILSAVVTSASAAEKVGLAGKLTDAAGNPVSDAEVILLELKREARTGEDGTFQFGEIPAGTYTVMVQGLGFAPMSRTMTFPTTERLDVTLTSQVLEMSGVEVTGSRVPRPALDSPLSTARLTHRDLEKETAISLSHATEHLPGVRNVSTGAQIGKPMIRGLNGARVLVLDDGHRMEDYSWSDEDGPSIDPTTAERIEVVRGPASVLYGSDAIGGVINALPPEVPETEEGEAPFLDGKLFSYFLSNNSEIGLGLNLNGARADWGWRFNVIGRKAESIHTPDGEIEHTGFESINGDAALGIHGSKGNASLRYARYGGEFKLLEGGGPPPGQEEGEEEGPERKASDDRIQFNGNLTAGTTRFEAKAQWQAHSLIELSDEFIPEGEGAARAFGPRHTMTRLQPTATSEKKEMEAFNLLLHTTTIDLMAHHQLGDHINGTAGVSGLLQSNDTRGPIPLVPDATGNGAAAFLYEEWRKGRLSLLAAGRVDARSLTADPNEALGLDEEVDRDYSEFSGDAGIVYRPGSDLALAVNVGRSFRAPTLFELFANGPQIAESRYLRGDDDLEAERGLNLDGGIRYEGSRVHGDVSAFRNAIDDFIALYPTGETVLTLPEYEYRATDAILTGIEVGLEAQVAGPLVLTGEFDTVTGDDDISDDPLPFIPATRGIVGARASWNELSWAKHFMAEIDVTIVGDKTRLAPNETGTDGYTLVGGELDIVERFAGRDWDLSVAVHNAGNVTYRDFLSRYKAFADNAGTDVMVRLGTSF